MSDIYQLMNVAGVKEDSDAIIDILNKIKDKKLSNDLRLLNYYNEIPVSYPAHIDDVVDEMADLSIHQQQAVAMINDQVTFLQSRHFPYDVIAKIFRLDINRCTTILSNFAYVQVRAQRREFVRVKVAAKVDVAFIAAEGKIEGRLDDISLGGLSFLSSTKTDWEDAPKGILSVALQNRVIEIPAVLLKISAEDGTYKYIFEIDAEGRLESQISRFVFQRQLEIIRELKDV